MNSFPNKTTFTVTTIFKNEERNDIKMKKIKYTKKNSKMA